MNGEAPVHMILAVQPCIRSYAPGEQHTRNQAEVTCETCLRIMTEESP